MHILIIEDEFPAVKRLQQLINSSFTEQIITSHKDSISGAVEWLSDNQQPDLIFCDIQLADGLSFEIFDQVKVQSPIIFTTAYDQFAIRAFKLNSIDYLLKPIDPEEFVQSIKKFKNLNSNQFPDLVTLKKMILQPAKAFKSRFLVKIGEKIVSVKTEEIAFFFSQDKTTYLQTHEKKKYIIDFTLDQVEEAIDPALFHRINRKYLTSLEAIGEIHSYFNSRLKVKILQHEDNDILISREKVAAFKDWLGQ